MVRGQGGRIAHLTGQRHERQADPAAGRIAGRPTLSRTGIGSVAVGPQRAAIDPGVGNGVDDLIPRSPQQVCGDRDRRNPNQQHMIQPDTIEAVVESEHALNLVGLDHRGENVSHRG